MGFRCAFWRWRFWRSERFRQQGKPEPRHMIRLFRSACTSSPWEEALTRIAPSLRWPNARCRLPAARPSATSTRITRAQRRRKDETTGGIAASIELIQLDDLACPRTSSGRITPGSRSIRGVRGAGRTPRRPKASRAGYLNAPSSRPGLRAAPWRSRLPTSSRRPRGAAESRPCGLSRRRG